MECGNQISDAVPLSMACSMACRFHAIDARLPPFLRLLDGVQVDEVLRDRVRRAVRRVGSSVGSGSSFTKTCRTAVFQFDAIAFGANVATSTSRSIVLLT